jgi:hypothetical protein
MKMGLDGRSGGIFNREMTAMRIQMKPVARSRSPEAGRCCSSEGSFALTLIRLSLSVLFCNSSNQGQLCCVLLGNL